MRNTPRSGASKSQASKQSQGKLQVFSLKPTHKGRPPGPARFRRATGRLIQGSTATPRHKARYIDAAPCHGPNLVFERSPEPPEVSLRLRDRGGTRQTAAMAQSYRRNILLRKINGQLKPVGWPAQASANCKTAPSGDEIAPMAPFELPRRSAGAISIPEDLPGSQKLCERVLLYSFARELYKSALRQFSLVLTADISVTKAKSLPS